MSDARDMQYNKLFDKRLHVKKKNTQSHKMQGMKGERERKEEKIMMKSLQCATNALTASAFHNPVSGTRNIIH